MVTSDIQPVPGNSDTITFPQRSYRKELVSVLMRNLELKIALQQESKQTKTSLKRCVYL